MNWLNLRCCFTVQVSLISKMVPSPDWFIGIDGFDLCKNGKWLDSITIEAIKPPFRLDSYSMALCLRWTRWTPARTTGSRSRRPTGRPSRRASCTG